MEYQVTATSLRPQKIEGLLEQEFASTTLQKSIEAGEIAHAHLFSGLRGCGKTTSTRIFAKVINCIEDPKASPCGKCTACQEINAGSCLNAVEIDGASNTNVNDVRQIKDEILFPPNSNRYKVYVIDEFCMLSIQIKQVLSIMLQLFKDIRFSIDPRYELELAVSRLAWLVDFVSPTDLKKAFDAARNILSGQAHSVPSVKQSANSNSYNQMGNVNSYNQIENENSFSQAGGLTEQFKAVLQRKAKLSQTEIEPKVESLTKTTTETNSVQNDDSNIVNSFQITRDQNEKKDITENENSELKNKPKVITENNVSEAENNIIDIEDIDSFRDSIIETIAKKNVLVSLALAQSKDWEIKNDKLFIFVKSSFDMSLLQKQISVVQNTIKQISGNHFSIILKEALSKKDVEPTVVENKNLILINWILDLFMGEVAERSLIS